MFYGHEFSARDAHVEGGHDGDPDGPIPVGINADHDLNVIANEELLAALAANREASVAHVLLQCKTQGLGGENAQVAEVGGLSVPELRHQQQVVVVVHDNGVSLDFQSQALGQGDGLGVAAVEQHTIRVVGDGNAGEGRAGESPVLHVLVGVHAAVVQLDAQALGGGDGADVAGARVVAGAASVPA